MLQRICLSGKADFTRTAADGTSGDEAPNWEALFNLSLEDATSSSGTIEYAIVVDTLAFMPEVIIHV